LQASQAVGDEAFTPLADGMSVAAQFNSDELVGRFVRLSGPQDNAATKDKGLRCGKCAEKGFELEAEFRSQFDGGGKGARHGSPPGKHVAVIFLRHIMAIDAPFG
jgi:hypothetical protein